MAKKPKPNDPPPDDDDDDEVEFSPRQLEVLNNTVTAAVSAHVGRKLKPIQDQLASLPGISESLEKLLAGNGNGNDGKVPGGQQGAGAQTPPVPDPEKIVMQKRLAALEDERKAERMQARNATRDATLTEIATKAGVDKNRLRGAVAILREQVKYDETANKHVMPVKRSGFDEDVDLDVGAAEFFKTDEGKAYLAPQQAPRGGSGSGRATSATGVVRGQAGATGGNNNAATGKQDKKVQAANDLMGAVGELLGGGNINVG